MAISKSQIPLKGSIGDLSFYTVRGSDKIVVRRKGGPSRETIRKSKYARRVRENNMEFKGRVRASQLIWRSLHPFRGINDYSVIGALHKPLKAIQDFDLASKPGERHLQLSRKPLLFEGLNLNRKFSLDAVIRTPIKYTVSVETGTAIVELPELMPELNLMLPRNYPFFQIIVTLGIVPDVHYAKPRYTSAVEELFDSYEDHYKSPWLQANKVVPSSSIKLAMKPKGIKGNCTYLLTAGVRIGTHGRGDDPEQVKYVGAAKVLHAKSVLFE